MTSDVSMATESFANLPGLRMHYVTAGPGDGAPVLLLHGFPEFWYSWRFQIPALATAGYRVIAPDQRGYNLTDKHGPCGADTLMDDIVHLLDHLGIERCHLVGHDWGAVVAWAFASVHANRVITHVSLNGPHPKAYTAACLRQPLQVLKSWYIYFFQLPWLPEALLRSGGYRFLDWAFGEIPAENSSPDDVAKYKEAIAQPGALSAMIGWYRTIPRQLSKPRDYPVAVPTLVIWGERDRFLHRACNDALPRYVNDLRVEYLPDASHWVQMHAPERVNRLMLDFFAKHSSTTEREASP